MPKKLPVAKVVTPKMRADAQRALEARRKRKPLAAVIRANVLGPTFERFLAVHELDLDRFDALAALEAMRAFYEAVSVEGRAFADGTDLLLFQAGTFGASGKRKTIINVTRQLYDGAGKSQQLGLDVGYDVALVDFGDWKLTLWNNKVPGSTSDFVTRAMTDLASRGPLPPPTAAKLRLDRF